MQKVASLIQKKQQAFKQENYWHHLLSPDRLVTLIGTIVTFPIVIFVFFNIQNGIWFNSLQYLTDQGNLFAWSFLCLYTFLDKRQLFKNNYFLILAMSYITFVFIGFNTMLLPALVQNAEFVTVYHWTSTVWFHMFSPIIDFTCGAFIMANVKQMSTFQASYKIVGYGMIYLAYQLVYFTCLPFLGLLYRLPAKNASYKYLGLTAPNNQIGATGQVLSLNGHGHNLINVSNQLLSHYNGANRMKFANAMVQNWYTYNHTSFVQNVNGTLVLKQIPNTTQLAHIYYNMGINFDAIRCINATQIRFFNQEIFSVYGTTTNVNPNVNIYGIDYINQSKVYTHLFSSLTAKGFNAQTSYNLYTDTVGSYDKFGFYIGCLILYIVILSFWWMLNNLLQKRYCKKLNIIMK